MFCKVYTVCIAYYRVYTVQCASMCDGHRTYIYGTRVEIYTQYTESTRSKFVEAASWYDTGIYQAVNWTHKSQQYKCWFFFSLSSLEDVFCCCCCYGTHVCSVINQLDKRKRLLCMCQSKRASKRVFASEPMNWCVGTHSTFLAQNDKQSKASTSLRYIFAKKHHHSCFAKLLL